MGQIPRHPPILGPWQARCPNEWPGVPYPKYLWQPDVDASRPAALRPVCVRQGYAALRRALWMRAPRCPSCSGCFGYGTLARGAVAEGLLERSLREKRCSACLEGYRWPRSSMGSSIAGTRHLRGFDRGGRAEVRPADRRPRRKSYGEVGCTLAPAACWATDFGRQGVLQSPSASVAEGWC
jgi:hypothetical protein